jgi:hypothetical protein
MFLGTKAFNSHIFSAEDVILSFKHMKAYIVTFMPKIWNSFAQICGELPAFWWLRDSDSFGV